MAVIDSYTPTTDAEWQVRNGFYVRVGQVFEGDGQSAGLAKFQGRKTGSPTGNAVAKIYSITGTEGVDAIPDSVLATSANFDVSTLTTSNAEFTITFSTPYATSNGTWYAIVFEYTGGSAGNAVMIRGKLSGAHGGNVVNDFGGWGFEEFNDLYFSVETAAAAGNTGAFLAFF